MGKHFIITGTGRCGTQWASEALSVCGVRCGHQAVYSHYQTLGRPVQWSNYAGDSSYEAVPMLPTVHKGIIVVALARHPLAVMRSWRSLGLFVDTIDTWESWGLLSRVLDRHFPEVLAAREPMAQAALFWARWLGAAVARANKVLKLEEVTTEKLFAAVMRPHLHSPKMLAKLPARINATPSDAPDRGPHCLSDIPAKARGPVMQLADKLRYEVT